MSTSSQHDGRRHRMMQIVSDSVRQGRPIPPAIVRSAAACLTAAATSALVGWGVLVHLAALPHPTRWVTLSLIGLLLLGVVMLLATLGHDSPAVRRSRLTPVGRGLAATAPVVWIVLAAYAGYR